MADATGARRVAAWVWALPPTRRDVERFARVDRWSMAVWVVVAVAAVVRYRNIAVESLWLDEVVSYVNVAVRYDSLAEIAVQTPIVEPHPPLYYLLLDVWVRFAGTAEAGIRGMSAVFGALTVLLTYLVVAKLLDDRLTGLVAAAMVAVSSMHLYFAQEARMYTVMTALTLASFYWYVDLVFADDVRRSSVLRYVVATVLLGYTHMYGLFVVLAQNVYLAAHFYQSARNEGDDGAVAGLLTEIRRSPLVRRWVPTQVTVAVLLAPWLVALAGHAFEIPIVEYGHSDWITARSFWYLAGTLEQYVFYNLRELPVWGLGFLVWVMLGLGVFAFFRPNPDVVRGDAEGDELSFDPSGREGLLAVWLVVPTVLPFLLSHVLDAFYIQKYSIAASLAFFALVAHGIGSLGAAYGDGLRYGLAALVVVAMATGVPATYDAKQKPDWRGAVTHVEDRAAAEDPRVVTAPVFVNDTVQYYADDGTTVRAVPPDATWDGQIAAATAGRDAVWFVFSFWHLNGGDFRTLVTAFEQGGYRTAELSPTRRGPGVSYSPGVYVVKFEKTGPAG